MTLARALSLALAAAAGALSVFAFAPFGWSGLIFVTFGVLAWRWQRATSAREAAGDGFAFGAGLF
ncbi:MAG TPA: apolipoprotein N-acyltransferase, partial [Casimicrobiaceae bacterium]